MPILEIALEQKCRKEAEAHKCLLIKIEKRKGYPDRILLSPLGRMVWIEFKREGEKPAPIQAYVHSQLREMKFKVFTIDLSLIHI